MEYSQLQKKQQYQQKQHNQHHIREGNNMSVIELRPFRSNEWRPAKSLPNTSLNKTDTKALHHTSTGHAGTGHLTGDGVVAYRAEEFHDVEKHASIYRQMTKTFHPPRAQSSPSVARIDLHPKWRTYWSLFQQQKDDEEQTGGRFVSKNERERTTVDDLKRKEAESHQQIITPSSSRSKSASSSRNSNNARRRMRLSASRQHHEANSLSSKAARKEEQQQQKRSISEMGLHLLPQSELQRYSAMSDVNSRSAVQSAKHSMHITHAIRRSSSRNSSRETTMGLHVQNIGDSQQKQLMRSNNYRAQLPIGNSSTSIVESYLNDQLKRCLRSVKRDNVNAVWLSANNPYNRPTSLRKVLNYTTIPQAAADVPKPVITKDVTPKPMTASRSLVAQNLADMREAVTVLKLNHVNIVRRETTSDWKLRSLADLKYPPSRAFQSPVSQSITDYQASEIADVSEFERQILVLNGNVSHEEELSPKEVVLTTKGGDKSVTLIVTTRTGNEEEEAEEDDREAATHYRHHQHSNSDGGPEKILLHETDADVSFSAEKDYDKQLTVSDISELDDTKLYRITGEVCNTEADSNADIVASEKIFLPEEDSRGIIISDPFLEHTIALSADSDVD